jgi:hypothetical protein
MTSNMTTAHPSPFSTGCIRHQFEKAVDRCRKCDEAFCAECLLYAFGESQPPFCMSCALAASGVRVKGARPTRVSRREVRRREKAAKEAARQAALGPEGPNSPEWSAPAPGQPVGDAFVAGESPETWHTGADPGRQASSVVAF